MIEFSGLVKALGKLKQHGRFDQIDLVENQKNRARFALACVFGQPLDDIPGVGVKALFGIDHQHHHIGLFGAAPGCSHHRPVKTLLGRENARRIDENDLGVADHRNAEDPVAGGLDLRRDDCHLGPDQAVDQSRFTGIRRAEHGDIAATHVFRRTHDRFSSISPKSTAAAACSAARLLVPDPVAGGWPVRRASTVNCGAWSGPSRSVTV